MPSAQFDHRVIAAAPRHLLWNALQDPHTYEGLGPVQRVWDATYREEILVGYRWSADVGVRKIEGTATTRQALAPELMVLHLDAGEFTGLLTIELEPEAGATAVTVVLSIEANGLLATLFFGAIKDAIGKGLPKQIDDLAARLASAG